MRSLCLILLLGSAAGVLAVSAPTPAAPLGQVLARQQLISPAVTTRGQAAGEVTVSVSLVRQTEGLQARATFGSTLDAEAVVNGSLSLSTPGGEELVRSNPRQLASLSPGGQAVLVTPWSAGDLPVCVDAQLTVWSGPDAPGPLRAARVAEPLRPVSFTARVCTS